MTCVGFLALGVMFGCGSSGTSAGGGGAGGTGGTGGDGANGGTGGVGGAGAAGGVGGVGGVGANGGNGGGGTCLLGGKNCDPALEPECLCAGCGPACVDKMTMEISDCVCGVCAADAFCSDPMNCTDDGSCDPFNEGCQCADCAAHPECP